MLAWITPGHMLLRCVSAYVFLPQIIQLIVICSPEPCHTYDVDTQTLGGKIRHYGRRKDPKNGEFIHMGLP